MAGYALKGGKIYVWGVTHLIAKIKKPEFLQPLVRILCSVSFNARMYFYLATPALFLHHYHSGVFCSKNTPISAAVN